LVQNSVTYFMDGPCSALLIIQPIDTPFPHKPLTLALLKTFDVLQVSGVRRLSSKETYSTSTRCQTVSIINFDSTVSVGPCYFSIIDYSLNVW